MKAATATTTVGKQAKTPNDKAKLNTVASIQDTTTNGRVGEQGRDFLPCQH